VELVREDSASALGRLHRRHLSNAHFVVLLLYSEKNNFIKFNKVVLKLAFLTLSNVITR
jgi:hypothetical protein